MKKVFSLVEIIVAAGLISAGLVVILGAFSSLASSSRLDNFVIVTSLLAENKLQLIEWEESLAKIPPEPIEHRGVNGSISFFYTMEPNEELELSILNFQASYSSRALGGSINVDTYVRTHKE